MIAGQVADLQKDEYQNITGQLTETQRKERVGDQGERIVESEQLQTRETAQ